MLVRAPILVDRHLLSPTPGGVEKVGTITNKSVIFTNPKI